MSLADYPNSLGSEATNPPLAAHFPEELRRHQNMFHGLTWDDKKYPNHSQPWGFNFDYRPKSKKYKKRKTVCFLLSWRHPQLSMPFWIWMFHETNQLLGYPHGHGKPFPPKKICRSRLHCNINMFEPAAGLSDLLARHFLRNPTQAIGVSFFFVSFNLINGIVLINVAIAVLLEKMVDDESDKHHHHEVPEESDSVGTVGLWFFFCRLPAFSSRRFDSDKLIF